ncbi:Signal recognition particle 14 kDa protein [Capsicum chinense]|nr:Signal recognition particle 14 kDa protein [Capsicum chinense]
MKRITGHGSVWVTLKHSSDKSKAQRNKMKTAGKNIEFKCLIRATGGKTNVGNPDDSQCEGLCLPCFTAELDPPRPQS